MTQALRKSVPEQFDLFLPYLADMPLRDQREMMERPFFSLAKRKRTKPIEYTAPDGKLWVHVSANPDYGMATIWDADILIYCASQLADMSRRGVNDVPRKLHIMPYDLLRAIGRPTTGRAYELLGQALDRLVAPDLGVGHELPGVLGPQSDRALTPLVRRAPHALVVDDHLKPVAGAFG